MYAAAEVVELNKQAAAAYAMLSAKTDPHVKERAELRALIGDSVHADVLYPVNLSEHLPAISGVLNNLTVRPEVRALLEKRHFERALETLPEEICALANSRLEAAGISKRANWLVGYLNDLLTYEWLHLLIFLQLASMPGNLRPDFANSSNPLAETSDVIEYRWRSLNNWFTEAEYVAQRLVDVLPPVA